MPVSLAGCGLGRPAWQMPVCNKLIIRAKVGQLENVVEPDSFERYCSLPRSRWVLAVTLASFLAVASAAQDADEDTDATPAEEVEEAPVVAQTELEDAPVVPMTEVEEMVVTGSRLARTPGELAGNLVVLDEDFIAATGEVTLERVLRQLPQNLNSTAEQISNRLNTASNLTGASTVNLRGLGAESTLILIDGKRAGYNGFLGGVTDVSSIPLSIVERIEVMLDGASAIYGSDAVGGVVNIITRKDYEGVEVDLNYNTPDGGEYKEWRGTISGGANLDGSRVRATYSRAEHSGLDGAEREATLFQRAQFAGPLYDVRFCCLPGQIHVPVLYRLDGDVLTLGEYNALSPEDQARASAETHAVLPPGFNESSSVDDITQFGPPNWGAATQAGYHILPETVRNTFSGSLGRDLSDRLSTEAHARYERRDTVYRTGYVGFSGETLGGGNPFNPLGRSVHLRGQRPDMGAQSTETTSDHFDVGIDFEGPLGDYWSWEASFGYSSEDSRGQRLNTVNRVALSAGLASDGVTPRSQFLSGETADSCAEKGWFVLFRALPGEPASVRIHQPFRGPDTLLERGPLSRQPERTEAHRWASAGGLKWLACGRGQGAARLQLARNGPEQRKRVSDRRDRGVPDRRHRHVPHGRQAGQSSTVRRSLGATGRCADVDTVDAVGLLRQTRSRLPGRGSRPRCRRRDQRPRHEDHLGAGLVFTPIDDITFRVNAQTAFVAPQLNQILRRTSERTASGFRGLLIQNPDGSLGFADALITEGGNPELNPETADTRSAGIELNPRAMPGLGLKATWNRTEYQDRISLLSAFIIDPDNPPSNTVYLASEDLWFQERRWINVSSVDREGMDYEAYYSTATAAGDFTAQVRHSRTSDYNFTLDPATDDPISVVGHTDGVTAIGVVSRSATTAQFSWGYQGLEASVDVSSRSKTSSKIGPTTTIFEPATVVDLSLRYSFSQGRLFPTPAWARDTRVTLTVNNVRDSFGTTQSITDGGAVTDTINDTRSLLYGRVFNLSLHRSM